jgi:hypothetical protein
MAARHRRRARRSPVAYKRASTFPTRSPKERDEKMRAQGCLAVASVYASCALHSLVKGERGCTWPGGCEWWVGGHAQAIACTVLRHGDPWVLFSPAASTVDLWRSGGGRLSKSRGTEGSGMAAAPMF